MVLFRRRACYGPHPGGTLLSAAHWLAQGGQAIAETLSGEKVKQWIEARIGSSQAQSHYHRLLHGNDLWAGGVSPGQEVQVDGALHVVWHEAD